MSHGKHQQIIQLTIVIYLQYDASFPGHNTRSRLPQSQEVKGSSSMKQAAKKRPFNNKGDFTVAKSSPNPNQIIFFQTYTSDQ